MKKTAVARLLPFLIWAALRAYPASADEPCANESAWYAYGQTMTIPNGTLYNPPASVNGLRGERVLPYPVPSGKELRLDRGYGGEAYNTGSASGIVYVPFIGVSPPTANSVFLHSVYASVRSNETLGATFIIPAGKILNYQIQSSYPLPYVVGWYMSGRLCDTD